MTVHVHIAPEARGKRAVLRIAIPAWGRAARDEAAELEPELPNRDDFKRLLDGALGPDDMTLMQMTRNERRQRAVTRRLRNALYGVAAEA